VLVVTAMLLLPRDAAPYSVLAHESNIDILWESHIRPLLARRYPRATADDLRTARAYAYGGSVIQDLGYYPFGSKFFSNLLHYVRSGELVETMIRDARSLDEYAFALGALAHYAADNTGHPEAVNRAVAIMFPELRAKYGDSITYVKSPAKHVIVELSFDIVQAAAGGYPHEIYHGFIGFQVAKPLLERAFREVYALEMKDVFLFDEDLAIGTYRHALSETIPAITRGAWRDKREEIQKLIPDIVEDRFVYTLPRSDYEREFGTDYKKPGWFDRLLVALLRIVPKIGPLKPLKFEAPTHEAEALFLDSLKDTRERYRRELEAVRDGRLRLPNTDFDTGRPPARGENELADETYAKLVGTLADKKFEHVSTGLRRHLLAHYDAGLSRRSDDKDADRVRAKEAKRTKKIARQLAELRSGADVLHD
jgi:hypothetical protein